MDPVERFIVLLHRRDLHLELDDKGVVWLTGATQAIRDRITDEDRSLVTAFKPALVALLKDHVRMQRLAPRTDSRPGARKAKGHDCIVHKSHAFTYAEQLANTCAWCFPEKYRTLSETPYTATEMFQSSGYGGLSEEEQVELEVHEAQMRSTMSRDEIMSGRWSGK